MEEKKKRKKYYVKWTEKEYRDWRKREFMSGVEAGEKRMRDKFIELLDLHNIFAQHKEDY